VKVRWFRPKSFGVRVVLAVAAVVFVPAAIALLSRETDIGLLTLLGLPLALLVGLWLAWRLLRALDELRRQALDRAKRSGAAAAVDVRRDDEIGDLAEAFDRTVATLHERRQATEAFVADVAHEVKNPIATVRACADALERGPTDPDRAARLARLLRESSARLEKVVSQLLELARIEAQSGERDHEWVDLDVLADGVASSVRDDARFAEVVVTMHRRGDARVRGDSSRLESALRNLVDNAASFAGPGGSVRVEVSGADDEVMVVVADDGPGISEANMARLFERFFTTRGASGGTGLGLAFVRAIAEAHGGTVEARSTPGRGATFTLRVARGGRRSHAFHS
jgi:signal transduction histidine kinase